MKGYKHVELKTGIFSPVKYFKISFERKIEKRIAAITKVYFISFYWMYALTAMKRVFDKECL